MKRRPRASFGGGQPADNNVTGQHNNQAEDNLTKAPAIAVRWEASSWNLPQL